MKDEDIILTVTENPNNTEDIGKKVLLSVFWDYKRVIDFELLDPGKTINA